MANLIFFGTPQFALPCLKSLHVFCKQHGHELIGAVCQPDKPSERGHAVHAPPVKKLALELGLEIWQPTKITSDFVAWFKEKKVDLGVVVAYGKILPQSLLDAVHFGFINTHASLLPRWRGAAPIQRAIEAGDTETGVCVMNLVAELDAGEIYHVAKTPIDPEENSGGLFERLSVLAAEALVQALPGILKQTLAKIPQASEGLSYAHRLKKEEALIDWSKSATQIINHVRAMHPWPGSFCLYQGVKLRLFDAFQMRLSHAPFPASAGEILSLQDGLVVATGDGLVGFKEAQLENRRRMPLRDLLNGFPMQVGEYLC